VVETIYSHESVLLDEVISFIPQKSASVVADLTLGLGGHSQAILQRCSNVTKWLGVDRDVESLSAARTRLLPFSSRVALSFYHACFSQIKDVLHENLLTGVDVLLADLGVSSPQLDKAERGFSFQHQGPLDMRMGQSGETLAEFLNRVSERDLAHLIAEYGEERCARQVARAIIEQRAQLQNTVQLAQCVRQAIPMRLQRTSSIDPATRTFQALRIALNQELNELSCLLSLLPTLLNDNGVALIISFHSLEDRMVKQSFWAGAHPCICPSDLPYCGCNKKPIYEILTPHPVVALPVEVERNKRARSAKLRVVRKLPAKLQEQA